MVEGMRAWRWRFCGWCWALCLGWAAGAAGAAPGPASGAATRPAVVFLGDSLAAGYGVDPAEAFPALIQQRIDGAGLNFEVVNAGVSGDTTAGGLRRLSWLLRRPMNVLVVELGGNDGLRGLPPSATRSNLVSIIRTARERAPGVEVVLAGMQMPPNLGPDYAREFRDVFPSVAKEQGAALIPHLLEGVGGNPDLNQPDLIHPTAAGHRKVAELVWEVLRPILEKRGPSKSGGVRK